MTGAARRHLSAGDLLAGVTVAMILVPQALAYAEIAGLPPIHGLYAAAVAPLVAAFFASSPYLQTGPVAMTALLTFGALSPLAIAGSEHYVELAALLALVVGATRLLIGLARAGVIAYFMSQPVLVGFVAAAAILIVASQVPTAVGAEPPNERLLARAWWAIVHPDRWEGTAIMLSLGAVALILIGRRLSPLFPGVLMAVAAGLAYSEITDYSGSTVGEVPSGFLHVSLALPWGDVPELILVGIVIALVGFAEPSAIARTFAAQDRQVWSADREFAGSGLANLASGFTAGMPVGGSFGRSALMRLAGGQSRWSGAVSALVVLAFLPFAGIIESLPRAVLGAIVIVAVAQFIRVGPILQIVRSSRPQGIVTLTTFAATLALAPRIEQGVLIGIGLGVAVHLWRELRIEVDTEYADRTLRLRPSGVLFFGSYSDLNDALTRTLAEHPEAERAVFDLAALGRIDYTGARGLNGVAAAARSAGLEVTLANVPRHAERIIGQVWDQELPRREVGRPWWRRSGNGPPTGSAG